MPRIRFERSVILETEGRNKGPAYEAGSEHDVSEDTAQRWLRRGVAVLVQPVKMGRPMAAPKAAADTNAKVAEEPAKAKAEEKPKAKTKVRAAKPADEDSDG